MLKLYDIAVSQMLHFWSILWVYFVIWVISKSIYYASSY